MQIRVKFNKIIRFSLLVIAMAACGQKKIEERIVVAKVLDKYLYLSDIQQIFPDNVSKEDSISLANAYITTWIKTQLLVNKAELNLPKDQADVEKQIEAYRAALLIHKYEEQMVNEKLDTIVSNDEIQQYYDQYTANFILDENLVKALFLKVSKTAPNIDNVKKWYQSDQEQDIRKLDSYCYSYATKYDFFHDDWLSFNLIRNELPQSIENEDNFIKTNKYIEQSDSTFYYFVNLKEFIPKGSVAPFNYVSSKIKDIIINKRKVKFLNDLETKIYNDAHDHNHFEIYNLDKK